MEADIGTMLAAHLDFSLPPNVKLQKESNSHYPIWIHILTQVVDNSHNSNFFVVLYSIAFSKVTHNHYATYSMLYITIIPWKEVIEEHAQERMRCNSLNCYVALIFVSNRCTHYFMCYVTNIKLNFG